MIRDWTFHLQTLDEHGRKLPKSVQVRVATNEVLVSHEYKIY